jgi:hypothetical protein
MLAAYKKNDNRFQLILLEDEPLELHNRIRPSSSELC